MLTIISNKIILSKNIHIFYLRKNSLILLKGLFGLVVLRLPMYYFYKINNINDFSFMFLKKYFFKSFLSHLNNFIKKISFIYFFRLRIKGLGYRIRKFTNNLYRFFFTSTNYFYFHVPKNILIKYKLRKLILISNDLVALKTILAHLLMLKKIIPYFLRGLFSPKSLIVLKPGKKAF